MSLRVDPFKGTIHRSTDRRGLTAWVCMSRVHVTEGGCCFIDLRGDLNQSSAWTQHLSDWLGHGLLSARLWHELSHWWD